jgi:hypothetical protein
MVGTRAGLPNSRLLWGSERAERLAAQLRTAGIEPEI